MTNNSENVRAQQDLHALKCEFNVERLKIIENNPEKIECLYRNVFPSLAYKERLPDLKPNAKPRFRFRCLFENCVIKNVAIIGKHGFMRHTLVQHGHFLPGNGRFLMPKSVYFSSLLFKCHLCDLVFQSVYTLNEHLVTCNNTNGVVDIRYNPTSSPITTALARTSVAEAAAAAAETSVVAAAAAAAANNLVATETINTAKSLARVNADSSTQLVVKILKPNLNKLNIPANSELLSDALVRLEASGTSSAEAKENCALKRDLSSYSLKGGDEKRKRDDECDSSASSDSSDEHLDFGHNDTANQLNQTATLNSETDDNSLHGLDQQLQSQI